MTEKYNASNVSLEQILSYIKSGEIAIPEIQRPFVWKPRQVRDLIDSLYMGYPTGYLIISQSPDMRLKDGSMSIGKKIMIDGQQRVTALMTSIVGMEVLGSDFKKRRIKIAFNPQASVETMKVAEHKTSVTFILQKKSAAKRRRCAGDSFRNLAVFRNFAFRNSSNSKQYRND